MRVIIAGSRDLTEDRVRIALNNCPWLGFASAIVSGGARGADLFGEEWAKEQSIDVHHYPADWEKQGKRAGPLRNELMSKNAEGLIAIWDGKSRGTNNMIELAKACGLRIFVYRIDLNLFEEYAASGDLGDLWELAEERASIMEFDANIPKLKAEREVGISILHGAKSKPY